MYRKQSGFTIVELLIVVIVLTIIVALSTASYATVQDRSRDSILKSDMAVLQKAITAARINRDGVLRTLTGDADGWTAGSCISGMNGTYPGSLPKTHACWQDYYATLANIGSSSGMDLSSLKKGDPWGAPYFIDENEGLGHTTSYLCRYDLVGVYKNPMPSTFNIGDADYGGSNPPNGLRYFERVQRYQPGCSSFN